MASTIRRATAERDSVLHNIWEIRDLVRSELQNVRMPPFLFDCVTSKRKQTVIIKLKKREDTVIQCEADIWVFLHDPKNLPKTVRRICMQLLAASGHADERS